MNALYGIGILGAILYWICVDATYFKICLCLLILYTLLTQVGTLTKYNNLRKKGGIATWNGTSLQVDPNSPELSVHLCDLRVGHHEGEGVLREETT